MGDVISNVVDTTAGKYDVTRDGKTVTVTGPGKLLVDDRIIFDHKDGSYIIIRNSNFVNVDADGNVTKTVPPASLK